MSCESCKKFIGTVCSDCFEHTSISKRLEKEWDEQEAKTQKEIEEEQLEINFIEKQQALGDGFSQVLYSNLEDLYS